MSPQERFKLKHQVFNEIDQLMERWEQRITPSNLRLADRFLNSDIHILLTFVLKDTGEVWVARLDKELLKPEKVVYPIGNKKRVSIDGEQHPMLIDVVEVMQEPERLVSTFVRFEPVDSFFRDRGHSLYFSNFVPLVSGAVLGNRKLCSQRRLLPISKNEMICQVVKGAPEIVNDITGCGDCVKGHSAEHLKLFKAMSACRVHLFQENLHLFVPDLSHLGIDFCEVLFGPLDLYAN